MTQNELNKAWNKAVLLSEDTMLDLGEENAAPGIMGELDRQDFPELNNNGSASDEYMNYPIAKQTEIKEAWHIFDTVTEFLNEHYQIQNNTTQEASGLA